MSTPAISMAVLCLILKVPDFLGVLYFYKPEAKVKLDENGNINPNDYILSPLTPNPNLKNYIQE